MNFTRSELWQHQQCETFGFLSRGVEQTVGEPAKIGLDVHAALEEYLIDKSATAPQVDPYDNSERSTLFAAGVKWIEQQKDLQDRILTIEGHGIPKKYRATVHDRPGGFAPVGVHRLEGIPDLVLASEDGENIQIVDWKSGFKVDDAALAFQAICYAWLCSQWWPGFASYEFRAVFLRFPGMDYTMSFSAANCQEAGERIREWIADAVKTIEASEESARTVGECCKYCPQSNTCPAVVGALEALPPSEVPADFVALTRQIAALKKIAKMAEGLLEQRNDALKAILKHGPQSADGTVYYLKEQVGRYEVEDRYALYEALGAIPGVNALDFFKPDAAAVRALDNPNLAPLLTARYNTLIKTKLGSVEPPAEAPVPQLPPPPPNRERGPTMAEKAEALRGSDTTPAPVKRGRGRPPGAKNKKTLARLEAQAKEILAPLSTLPPPNGPSTESQEDLNSLPFSDPPPNDLPEDEESF